jgi:hypothetical protein
VALISLKTANSRKIFEDIWVESCATTVVLQASDHRFLFHTGIFEPEGLPLGEPSDTKTPKHQAFNPKDYTQLGKDLMTTQGHPQDSRGYEPDHGPSRDGINPIPFDLGRRKRLRFAIGSQGLTASRE